MYQTFDGCDGIHARRIGQSSPLGELFDHSIDSINATLCLFLFCSLLSCGYTYTLVWSHFVILCNFYVSTWEEYHTHVLYLSEFSGPVEGILCMCAAFTITGILGPEFVWHTKIFSFLHGGEMIDVDTSILFVIIATISLGFNIVTARNNVINYYAKDNMILNVNGNIRYAFSGLIPFFTYFLSIFFLTYIEPDFICFAFVISVGLTMAFVVGRIIVNHLTKQPFPMWNIPTSLPTIQFLIYFVATHVMNYEKAEAIKALSWLGLGIAFGIHAFFINEIIYDFTRYLDVYALSIKHPKFV